MTKILHTSDNHIDFYATCLDSSRYENGENVIYKKRLEITKQIIECGVKLNVDAFVFAGDFHNKLKPPPQEYTDVNELFDTIPSEIPVYIIHGNHDEPTLRGAALGPLVNRRPNIHVALKHEVVYWKGIHYILAPWGTPYSVVAKTCNLIKDTKVLIYHVGVKFGNLHWAEIEGEEGTVTVEQLQNLDSYTMLGHYHGQVEVAPNIYYCGSPEVFNFGEQDQKKGYLIWTIGQRSANVKSYEVDYTPFVTIKAQDFIEQDFSHEDAYVRIKGEVTELERTQVLEKLRKFNCLGYKLDLQNVMKSRKVFSLQGRSNIEILKNYLESKKTTSIDDLLSVDQEIEKDVRPS
jgi:DNA repair exonuclease SbcCD nuclease subunit